MGTQGTTTVDFGAFAAPSPNSPAGHPKTESAVTTVTGQAGIVAGSAVAAGVGSSDGIAVVTGVGAAIGLAETAIEGTSAFDALGAQVSGLDAMIVGTSTFTADADLPIPDVYAPSGGGSFRWHGKKRKPEPDDVVEVADSAPIVWPVASDVVILAAREAALEEMRQADEDEDETVLILALAA